MPNWCHNSLTVSGPDADLDSLLANASKTMPYINGAATYTHDEAERAPVVSHFSLKRLLPVPEDLIDNGGWYDWCIKHWGTKWEVQEETFARKPGKARVTFLSAWNPPLAALKAVSRDYPSLRFSVAYDEEGGNFCGEECFENGV